MAAATVAGVDRFLLRALEESIAGRAAMWQRDLSNPQSYAASVEPNRQRLARMIGVRDARPAFQELEFLSDQSPPAPVARAAGYDVWAVAWPALIGLRGEGLLLEPEGGRAVANVVAIADCEQTPEMIAGVVDGVSPESQFARRLAERGCRVLVPALIDRRRDMSVIADGKRRGDVTHRELLYRGAYQMGRQLIGYEVQKVLAALDWFRGGNRETLPVAVVGYGEGALLGLYAAALDARIDVTGVSGHFDSRQHIWREPIDRNVFGLLAEFGDAEIGSLILPRPLIVEACAGPALSIPPGTASAPARIETPPPACVRAEVERLKTLVRGLRSQATPELVVSGDGNGPCGTTEFLGKVVDGCRRARPDAPAVQAAASTGPIELVWSTDSLDAFVARRRGRQFHEILDFNERLIDESGAVRREFLSKLEVNAGLERFLASAAPYRDQFHDRIIGPLGEVLPSPGARSRLLTDTPEFRGYDVVLDVLPDVILYGILLVPKDMAPAERRPVVVCQHGLEGRAEHTVEGDKTSYRDFATRLARRGFVTFSPQHLYNGGDAFRTLQRKANPLGKSLFAVMVAQHRQLLDWLRGLDFVDAKRIAFYGISYGGKSAMRIPAVLDGYCLSICSSDYSDWVWRTVSQRFASGYLVHSEYEIFEFDLGNTFNYAEMAYLIAPRPFMVERFHDNDFFTERMLMEFAKVRLLYESLKIEDRLGMTYYARFQTPSPYAERATFDFLHQHLDWPKRD